ncbi:MAG: bifunctional 2-polyprenyl-6-hydroxyphenol methylase/3-demethylubiquinol 3-O-methyltransferase UbiG [Alphaproteobacteria bacterium]|nr:bifunctional 2-polyprenyl-6-hydroxyphenol methylase/3-demethylubiquinol 3-O-methyltransferase UbiG [Alphaproteobacteria bacterium]
MANATLDAQHGATIRPEEAAHFGALAADWWDARGSSAMLHRLNPVRLAFIRDALDVHFACSADAIHPLAGRRALDVGCGAGLLCEPIARLGAQVTGVDAASENIAAARDHARAMDLAIDYRCGELADLDLPPADLVCCLEVIEHVADKGAFVSALARHLAPGGLMILSTPNRTAHSRLLLVGAAERLGAIPKGTHHWDDFVAPADLHDLLAAAGLAMGEPRGISWSPLKGLHLSDDLSLNYILTAQRN